MLSAVIFGAIIGMIFGVMDVEDSDELAFGLSLEQE